MYKTEFDPRTMSVAELVAEVLRLRSDLARIAADFVIEANEREWCGEYDQWVRIENKRLTRPVFIERQDLHRDPNLDESGRFTAVNEAVTAQAAAPPAQPGVYCAACGMRH